MVTVCGSVANATLVRITDLFWILGKVGYDVFSATPFLEFSTAKFPRKVRTLTVVGDNAVASCTFDLQYGARQQMIGIHNNQTALEPSKISAVPCTSLDTCWPDEKLMLVVTDAPAASM